MRMGDTDRNGERRAPEFENGVLKLLDHPEDKEFIAISPGEGQQPQSAIISNKYYDNDKLKQDV